MAYERNPDVIATALPGETVLLDPATRAMFTLNGTGAIVWTQIEEGLDAIAGAIARQFDVTVERARVDAATLIDELVATGLLRSTAAA